jgi:hypothetical protein
MLPDDARGTDATYARPEGTRVYRKTLRYRTRGGTVGKAFNAIYERKYQRRYYHSGVNRAPYLRWVAEERTRTGLDIGAMVNMQSAAQPALLKSYVDYPDVPLVLDSGAYQGEGRTVDEYMDVLKRIDDYLQQECGTGLGERFEWVANLDVIEGLGTGQHFFQLRERGIEPLWVGHVTEGRIESRSGLDFRPRQRRHLSSRLV